MRDGQTTAIIGQPYIQDEKLLLNETMIVAANEFCRIYEIEMQLSGEQSWHLPGPPFSLGHTVAVIFTSKDWDGAVK